MSKIRYEMTPSYNDFADNLTANLRRVRKEANLTQEQLADVCDVSVSTIRKLENGFQKISAYVVKLYCDACNVRATEIIPPTITIQKHLAENSKMIDAIVTDLQALDNESLELIHVITQHLSSRNG